MEEWSEADRAWDSEQYLNAIASAVNALIFLKDTCGRYLLVNNYYEREFGIRREDTVGMSDAQVFGEEVGKAVGENDRKVLESGQTMYFEETIQDGRTYLSSKFPLRRPDGTIYAVGGISSDITLRSRTEREIRAAKEAADQANKAMTEFLSRMSHELRTPLNSILGFAQILQQDCAGDVRVSENVDRIAQAGHHLLTLINEVLDLSRTEHREEQLALEPVLATTVFQEALDLLRPVAANRNIEIARDFHRGMNVWVMANPRRLTQVLLNVLSNAVKYNGDGGLVTASFDELGGKLKFLVADTGPGLDPADVERIFMPFERLDADSSNVEGTGLGLTLSRNFAHAMGGRIGVSRTKKGRGSEFFVEMPITTQPQPVANTTDTEVLGGMQPDQRGVLDGVRVLYIEDDENNIELVRQLLFERAKADLLVAVTGEQGLNLAHEHQPHVIMLDMHLPGMEGGEVLTALRHDPATTAIPIVILSADAIPSRIREVLKMGANDYITKPIDGASLIQTVQALALGPKT